MFDPPEGQTAYDYVFDFTGEVRHDRTEMVGGHFSPSLDSATNLVTRFKSLQRVMLQG